VEAATSNDLVLWLIKNKVQPLIPKADLMLSTVSRMTSSVFFDLAKDLEILINVS
jgi:hypothetical protein